MLTFSLLSSLRRLPANNQQKQKRTPKARATRTTRAKKSRRNRAAAHTARRTFARSQRCWLLQGTSKGRELHAPRQPPNEVARQATVSHQTQEQSSLVHIRAIHFLTNGRPLLGARRSARASTVTAGLNLRWHQRVTAKGN